MKYINAFGKNDFDKNIKNQELQIKQKLHIFDKYILVKLLERNAKNKQITVKTH